MGYVATTACLLAMMSATQSSTLPWVFPSDFRERPCISDLVVSGTIEDTSVLGVQVVNHTELVGYVARIRIDRVFQGSRVEGLQFAWFKYHATTKGGGVIYSGLTGEAATYFPVVFDLLGGCGTLLSPVLVLAQFRTSWCSSKVAVIDSLAPSDV
jgi:hypothetical protein